MAVAAFWLAVTAFIVVGALNARRGYELKMETIRLMMEKGQKIDDALLRDLLTPAKWYTPPARPVGAGYRTMRIFGTLALFVAPGLAQQLFAGYEPTIPTEPFFDRTLVALHREIRRAQVQSFVRYVLAAVLVIGLVALTAAPLTLVTHELETRLHALGRWLSPGMAQISIYSATLAFIALTHRRLAAFLAPW